MNNDHIPSSHPSAAPSHLPPESYVGASHQLTSGASWGAILAGATAAASLTLILLLLGVGFGLSSVSPWSGEGISAGTLSISAILWITFMSLVASGVGGYVAGRLRTKWVGIHTDEVYFRDTAHGFLAWGISTLAMATLLTSATGAIITGGAKASAEVAGGIASTASTAMTGAAATAASQDGDNPLNYFIDSLFRSDTSRSGQGMGSSEQDSANNTTSEVTRIFANALAEGDLPEEDLRHVARLVSQNTNLTQQQAERRVTEVYDRTQQRLEELETSAKEAADTAKKASAYASLWFSVALLIGAFVACLAAICGGRQRDI